MSAESSSPEAGLEAAEHIRRYNVWQGIYDAAVDDTLHLDGLVSNCEGEGAIINIPGQKHPSLVIQPVHLEGSAADRIFVTERKVGQLGDVKGLNLRTIVLYQDGSAPNTIEAWHHITGKNHRLLGMINQEAHEASGAELLQLDSVFGEVDEARRFGFAKRAGDALISKSRASLGQQVGKLIKKYTR